MISWFIIFVTYLLQSLNYIAKIPGPVNFHRYDDPQNTQKFESHENYQPYGRIIGKISSILLASGSVVAYLDYAHKLVSITLIVFIRKTCLRILYLEPHNISQSVKMQALACIKYCILFACYSPHNFLCNCLQFLHHHML